MCAALPGCVDKPKGTKGKRTDFTLKDTHGNDITLSDFKGKVVMLEFWSTTCPPCVKAIPEYSELYRKLKDKGFEIIGVSLDQSVSNVQAFIKEHDVPFTIVMATDRVEKQYGIVSIPTTFLLDKKGVVIKRHMGYAPGITEDMEKDIRLLLEDMPVKNNRKVKR